MLNKLKNELIYLKKNDFWVKNLYEKYCKLTVGAESVLVHTAGQSVSHRKSGERYYWADFCVDFWKKLKKHKWLLGTSKKQLNIFFTSGEIFSLLLLQTAGQSGKHRKPGVVL